MLPRNNPEALIFPPDVLHQQYLLQRMLGYPGLPKGAAGLIRETLGENVQIFRRRSANGGNPEAAKSAFFAQILDGGNSITLPAENRLLTVWFGPCDTNTRVLLEEIRSYRKITLSIINLGGMRIYPDHRLAIGIDRNGNSRHRRFLLEIPETLIGNNGELKIIASKGSGELVAVQYLHMYIK